MYFSAEQANEVKAWMVKKLENISDADPEILGEYSWAILQSEASNEEIRRNAIENLEDFLKEHTVNFVDEVFARYVPQNPPSTITVSTQSAAANIAKQAKNGSRIGSHESFPPGSQAVSEKFNTSRKRSYHDANSQGQDGHDGNGVASKSSRSKRDRRDARSSGRRVSSQQLPSPVAFPSHPFINAPPAPTPPPGFPHFDATNPMAAYAFMQTMFPQMASMPPLAFNGEMRSTVNKLRCQDYDTKGYCTLGSSCPYEHGDDLIVAPRDNEYDPTRANFSMNGTKSSALRAASRSQQTRKHPGNLGHTDAKRNNRAAFSDPRRPPDQSFASIFVQQIPEEYFEDETVRIFFSQYGKVLDVTMKPYKRLAIVKYDSHVAAKRAWESPKAVFENRFVKVYWHKPDFESTETAIGNVSAPNDTTLPMNAGIARETAFKHQQDVKQKAHMERMRTRTAMEDARQDLVRRRENITKERQALVANLAIAGGQDLGDFDARGTKSLENGTATDSPDPKIKALRDQLARMQAEAKSLGIDPDAPPHDLRNASSTPRRDFGNPIRGGFAASSVYGGYGPSRGNYRRHGFVRGRNPSVKKLDNRPKSITMSGVNFDEGKEENLRSYLTLIGPFEDIELNPQRMDSRIIVFKERWQAEMVMHGKSDIPGVGIVEMSWVPTTANGKTAQTGSNDEDVVLGDALDNAKRTFSEEAPQPQNDNLDVAGGDDDDWGNVT